MHEWRAGCGESRTSGSEGGVGISSKRCLAPTLPFFLWAVAESRGYASPYWMTFRQALELGAHVRKGESGSFSVFYSSARKTDTDRETGEKSEKTIRFMKWNHVFNASQIEGLPAHYYPEPLDPKSIGELSAEVQAFLDAIPIRVVHGGDSAHYTPSTDTVTLPSPNAFHSIEAYFSTRCHEVCNIASVLISRTVDGLCALLFPNHRTACCAISGRES